MSNKEIFPFSHAVIFIHHILRTITDKSFCSDKLTLNEVLLPLTASNQLEIEYKGVTSSAGLDKQSPLKSSLDTTFAVLIFWYFGTRIYDTIII